MDKRIIAGAIIALIAIAAIVFVLYQQQEAQPLEQDYEPTYDNLGYDEQALVPLEENSPLDECGTQTTSYMRDLCWLFKAGEEFDASKCLNIESRPTRIDCIRSIAAAYQSEALQAKLDACDALMQESMAPFYDCRDKLEPQVRAEKTAICDKYLQDDKTQLYMCHSTVAVGLNDTAICDALPTQPTDFKAHCLSMVAGEYGS
ncbi:MAG: hypothetical protein WC634_03975 [archaeon]